jgi:hypothetical protein
MGQMSLFRAHVYCDSPINALMLYDYPDDQLITYRTVDGIYNARQNTNVPAAIQPYERPPFDVLDLFGVN